jgi:hypothetical protein
MPHFECGAFNHSATSPREGYDIPDPFAGSGTWLMSRCPEGLGLSVRPAR